MLEFENFLEATTKKVEDLGFSLFESMKNFDDDEYVSEALESEFNESSLIPKKLFRNLFWNRLISNLGSGRVLQAVFGYWELQDEYVVSVRKLFS